jgi:tetratricopeptide (TPR) repeat protein
VRHPSFVTWIVVSACAAFATGCVSTANRPSPQQSWTEKLGSSVKNGTSKLAAAVKPKPELGVEVEPNSNKKMGAGVFVAMAEMHERSGNIEEAETQLRKALAIDPNHLGALMAYGHLEDRQKDFSSALKYYQKAARKHPKVATVHNDLGLCYHRQGKLKEAAKSLRTAVELESHRKLFHDNLAAVLVDQGRPNEALAELTAAHGEAVGNYNLGYLLVQKRDRQAALYHFHRAAELEPSLVAAQQWIATLSPSGPRVGTMVAQRDPRAGYAPVAAPPAYPQTSTGMPTAPYPNTGAPPAETPASSRRNPFQPASAPR